MAQEKMTRDEAEEILVNADRRLCAIRNELGDVPLRFLGRAGVAAASFIDEAIETVQQRLGDGAPVPQQSLTTRRLGGV